MIFTRAKVGVLVTQLRLTLWTPRTVVCSYVRRVFQARILEWVAFHVSKGSFQWRDQTQVSYTGGKFFMSEPLWWWCSNFLSWWNLWRSRWSFWNIMKEWYVKYNIWILNIWLLDDTIIIKYLENHKPPPI